MTKDNFIQQFMIRSLPGKQKFAYALAHAEWLWAELTKAGYGEKQPITPRKSKDWYGELNERQKKYFLVFWDKFNLKIGRNEAAERWLQLGELTHDEYQRIIAAAEKEANKVRRADETRKHAPGWLFEKRWDDYQPAASNAKHAANIAKNHLMNELAGLKKLHEAQPSAALAEQISKLETQLETLK